MVPRLQHFFFYHLSSLSKSISKYSRILNKIENKRSQNADKTCVQQTGLRVFSLYRCDCQGFDTYFILVGVPLIIQYISGLHRNNQQI
jgi:hypothetical protein